MKIPFRLLSSVAIDDQHEIFSEMAFLVIEKNFYGFEI